MDNIYTNNDNLPPGFIDRDLNTTGGGKEKEIFNLGTMVMQYNKLWDSMSESDKEYILKYDKED